MPHLCTMTRNAAKGPKFRKKKPFSTKKPGGLSALADGTDSSCAAHCRQGTENTRAVLCPAPWSARTSSRRARRRGNFLHIARGDAHEIVVAHRTSEPIGVGGFCRRGLRVRSRDSARH